MFFVQGPLATLAERKFEWAEELEGYGKKIEESLKRRDLSADPLELLKMAKGAGVALLACGAWAVMLGVADKLPPEVTVEDPAECVKQTLEAKKIMTIA